MTTITPQDDSGDVITPTHFERFDPEAESGNIIHDLIDGSIAVTLVGDRYRAGTLVVQFTSDSDAEAARVILGRKTWFVLDNPERPAFDLTFVREGRMSPVIRDDLENVWRFEVGFQEIDS